MRPASVVPALFALSITLASPAQAGDDEAIAAGKALYERCVACHSLGRNRTGPDHCGVVGRPAGALPDYAYSAAMRESGLVWTAETLDAFLTAPRKAVPGTKMGYAGVDDAAERRALIAYLAWASANDPACRTTD